MSSIFSSQYNSTITDFLASTRASKASVNIWYIMIQVIHLIQRRDPF